MPKQTFENLPEEKQAHILACAIDEFAEHGYDRASISRIVAAAGIAKGSFYQYFLDKEDLYGYVVGKVLVERKLDISSSMEPRLEQLTLTMFLRELFLAMVDLFSSDAKAVQISLDFVRNQHGEVQKRIAGTYRSLRDNYYQNFILQEQSRREIDPEVDADILGAMLLGVSYQISGYIQERGLDGGLRDYLERCIDKVEYILSNGIYRGCAPPDQEVNPPEG